MTRDEPYITVESSAGHTYFIWHLGSDELLAEGLVADDGVCTFDLNITLTAGGDIIPYCGIDFVR